MIGATIRKDVALLVRDRGRLLMLFAMPVIFIVVFGSMFGGKRGGDGGGDKKPIAIAFADGDPRGLAIEHGLDAAPGFTAKHFASGDDVHRAVASGDLAAGVIVPAAPWPVELSIDLGAPVQVTGPLQGALTAVVMRALAPPPTGAPPMVVAKSPPGVAKAVDDVSGFQVTVPGNAVLFGFFIAMTVAISFAHERTTGTWRRLLAAPVPRWKALVGKMVPYYLIGCLQLALLFGLGAGAFGMKIAGSIAALVALSALVVACASAVGLLVASFGWTERQIGSTVPVILLVMGLVGGCMFPRLMMPPFMKSLGLAVPHAWALDGYYAVLIREGTSLATIAPQLGALAGFTILFAGIGIARFKFE